MAATPAAPTATALAAASTIDRLNFGDTSSEKAFSLSTDTTATAGVGGFSQPFRQLKFVPSSRDATANEMLTFTLKVDPVKQNYVTIKLWGSDYQGAVLHVTGNGFSAQLDNNISSSPNTPPFYGRFHYATQVLPLTATAGKTSIKLSLYAGGYYYDAGGDKAGTLTRGLYSAFTHTDPYFVPPAGEKTGPALVQVGTEPPPMVDKATVFTVLKRSRANIYNLDGVPNGFWNPGGTLANHGSVIAPGTPGAPPEVIGMHMWDGPVTAKNIADNNATASPADTWRQNVAGRQMTAITLYAAVYLTPPLKDADGNVVPGYDKYLDPVMLDRLVGLIDGHARSLSDKWTPKWSAGWFDDQSSPVGRSILRILDNPAAAAAFKLKLKEKIDYDGVQVTRASVYEKLLAGSANSLGFGLKALTSDNYFDKFGGTVTQSMIWVGNAYPCQLALRALLAIEPTTDADKQPIDPASMRAIVRQLSGLDDMKYMNPATPGYRTITKGGISETYGNAASGYDGRYGNEAPQDLSKFASLVKYDSSMTPAEREEFAAMARRSIEAFDAFLYPQHYITVAKDGSVTDAYMLGQEDVISWRVPYGPNANGWFLNLQTLAVDPNGSVKSPQARRSFLIKSGRDGAGSIIDDMAFYAELEAAWKSIAGVDPATIAKLPGEPGAPDYVWADIDSGAFAMAYKGERLFFNANFNRDQNKVNQVVRVHHVTDLIDREASVRMPFDATTVQSDGNLSGDFNSAWVVRYGRYLVVMNRAKTPYAVQLPANTSAVAMRAKTTVTKTTSVAAGDYEVFVLP